MLDRRGCRDTWPRRRARVGAATLAGLVIAAGAVAGCGGGSSTPTKAQYIEKVNALCVNEKQAMDAVALSKQSLAGALDASNVERERADALIAAVKLPKSEPISSEWLAQRQAALKGTKAISAAGIGKPAAHSAERAYFVANQRAERLAKAYGLARCVGFAAS